MTADSSWPLQQSVDTALRADGTLIAFLADGADGIYDGVPQDSVFPYVVIGDTTVRPNDTMTEEGAEATITIHTWDSPDADADAIGYSILKQIMSAIVDALDDAALSVAGHTLVLLRFEFSDTFLDPDGLTRHGVQRFRALTQAE